MKAEPHADPLALLGSWELSRRIEDRAAGEQLSVTGTSELVLLSGGRIGWDEQGTLQRGDGTRLPVSRRLLIERRTSGWMVLFADGRDFHPWIPGSEVVHPCGADVYRGRIEVLSPQHWQVTWDVQGPAKDLTLHSTLLRS